MDLGELKVRISADMREFTTGVQRAQAQMQALGPKMQSVGASMRGIGTSMTLGLTAPLVAFGALGVKGLMDAERASAQTAAALKSTGNSARTSVSGIESLAMKLREMSGVDDELIQKGANVMLTFTKISNEGGRAGGNFDKATAAALDMSVALGTDMSSAAMLVGKALNDPVKGITALQRSGVQLTEQQKKQIKTMTKAGDVAGAQGIILKELETQFGGSARAAGDTFAGQLSRAKLSLEETAEAVMRHAMPAISRIAEVVSTAAKRFGDLSPRMQQVILVVAGVTAVVGPLLIVAGMLVGAIGALLPVIAAISAPVLIAIAVIGALVVAGILLYRNSEEVRDIVRDAYEAMADGVEEIIGELKDTIVVWVRWAKAFWSQYGEDISRAARAAWELIEQIIGGNLTAIAGVVKTILAVLRGDWSAAWEGIKQIFNGVWQAMSGVIGIHLQAVVTAVQLVWNAIREGVAAAWDLIATAVENWAGSVVNRTISRLDDIRGRVIAVWTTVRETVAASWDLIADATATWAGSVVNRAIAALDDIRGRVVGVWNSVRETVGEAWGFVAEAVATQAGAVVGRGAAALQDLVGRVTGVWTSIREGVAGAWGLVSNAVASAAGSLVSTAAAKLGGLVSAAASAGARAGAAFAKALKDAVNSIISRIKSIALPSVKVGNKTIGGGKPFSGLPYLARGGITDGMSIAGEAGPEAVIPLGGSATNKRDARRVMAEAGLSGSGGSTFNFHYHGADPDPFVASRKAAFAFQTAGLA